MKFIYISLLSIVLVINGNDNNQISNRNISLNTNIQHPKCTILNNSFNRLLKRKKRFVVFPQDGAILITFSLGKALLSGFPRGMVMSLEVDSYTPVPDTLEKWKPTIFLKNREKNHEKDHKPKLLTTTTTPIPEIHNYHMEDHHPDLLHFTEHDHHDYNNQYHHQDDHHYDNFSPDFLMMSHNKTLNRFDYLPQYYDHKWKNWKNLYFRENYENDFNKKYTKNSYEKNFVPWLNLMHNKNQKKIKIPEFRQHYKLPTFPKHQTFPSFKKYNNNNYRLPNYSKKKYLEQNEWMYHRGHRERRQIFNEFDKIGLIIGINMKSCILRAICEAKHFLLPKGVSLIHDVLRIVFTIPYKNHWNDVYSNAAKIKDPKCRKVFAKDCPFSVLEFFIFNERVI